MAGLLECGPELKHYGALGTGAKGLVVASPQLSLVETIWISERVAGEDFQDFFRPSDSQTRLQLLGFALHSMGWIRVDLVSGFVDVHFDARSVSQEAINHLIDFVTRRSDLQDARKSSALLVVNAFTGRSWMRQSHTEPIPFIECVLQLTEFKLAPNAPSVIVVDDLPASEAESLGGSVARDLKDAWLDLSCDPGGMTRCVNERFAGMGVKVLRLEGEGFRLETYDGSPVWPSSQDSRRRPSCKRIEDVVPDIGLAQNLIRSVSRTLQGGSPRLEGCVGPIRTGPREVRMYDWLRYSLPLWDSPDAEAPSSVVVAVWERTPSRLLTAVSR